MYDYWANWKRSREDAIISEDEVVIIGGKGGSGTRVLVQILKSRGIFFGNVLNESNDSMDIVPFTGNRFKDSINYWYARKPVSKEYLEEMIAHMKECLSDHRGPSLNRRWGIKVPQTCFFLPFFDVVFPNVKYVHLVRDGRCMALANNRNEYPHLKQTVMKECLDGKIDGSDADKKEAICLWAAMNDMIADYGEAMEGRYLRMRFEEFVGRPLKAARELCGFCGVDSSDKAKMQEVLQGTIDVSRSKPRWTRHEGMTDKRINEIGALAGKTLVRFGYPAEIVR